MFAGGAQSALTVGANNQDASGVVSSSRKDAVHGTTQNASVGGSEFAGVHGTADVSDQQGHGNTLSGVFGDLTVTATGNGEGVAVRGKAPTTCSLCKAGDFLGGTVTMNSQGNGDSLKVTGPVTVSGGPVTAQGTISAQDSSGATAAISGTAAGSSSLVENGLQGISNNKASGVYGENSATNGLGLAGRVTWAGGGGTAAAVYGQVVSGGCGSCLAGLFDGSVTVNGDLQVNGTLSKLGGSFKIDDPIDPANRYLQHSFVESPDMMDVYNGNVRTDARGFATIRMPRWFGALNRDFRYQLTPIRSFARATVWREIAANRFTIRTDGARVLVSWQVTGIRHDAWANAHRIPTETLKPFAERGTYFAPRELGKSTQPASAAPQAGPGR